MKDKIDRSKPILSGDLPTQERIQIVIPPAVRGEAPPPAGWDARERALLAFSVAISERPAESVELLLPHFSEPQIVELVTLGSATVLLNRFATALELPW